MKTFVKVILIVLYILYAAAAGAQGVQGYMHYRYVDVDSALGIPADTATLSPAAKLKPHLAVSRDSTFMIWSVALQKYIIPRSAASVSVYWSDLLGPISGNAQLMDSLQSKQQVLPYSGGVTDYIGGDHLIHSLDSIIAAMDFVRSTDTVFQNIQSGTADSLHFQNGLYRVGNDVNAHYEWSIWDANKIQGKFVEAIQPRNKAVMQWDSLSNVIKWTPMDSLAAAAETDAIALAALIDTAAAIRADFPAGGSPTPTLDQVLAAGNFSTRVIWTSNAMYSNGISISHDNSNIVTSVGWGTAAGTTKSRIVFNTGLTDWSSYNTTYFQPQSQQAADNFLYLPYNSINNSSDTVATMRDVRSAGSGGGATPGIDAVLAAGGTATSKTLMINDGAGNSLTTIGSDQIRSEDQSGMMFVQLNLGDISYQDYGSNSFYTTLRFITPSVDRLLYVPNESDTLATRGFARSLLGGSITSEADPLSLHLTGTSTQTGKMTLSGSLTAPAGGGESWFVYSPTMLASAANQALYAMVIQPTITTNGFSNIQSYGLRVVNSVGYGVYGETGTWTGVTGAATTSGTGVSGTSNSGTAISGNSQSGNAANLQAYGTITSVQIVNGNAGAGTPITLHKSNTSSTNVFVESILMKLNTSGTAAAGLGNKISSSVEASDGTVYTQGFIGSKWIISTFGSRASQWEIWGVNNAAAEAKIIGFPAIIQDLADNTAALAAGLTAGDTYRTGDTLKIVH